MNFAPTLTRALLLAGTVALGTFIMPAAAQDAQKVQQMQRVIDAQQTQLEAQQSQHEAQQRAIDAQRALLKQLQSQIKALSASAAAGAAPDGAATGTEAAAPSATARQGPTAEGASVGVASAPPAATAPPSRKTGREASRVGNRGRYDTDSPTGSNASYPKAAATLKMPELKTEVSISGFAELQIMHDTDGLGINEFDTFRIPVDGAPSETRFSVNPSRFGFTSTTQLGYGRINTLLTMDFNGQLDAADPRLRQAYGEFIHDDLDFAILGGQAFATMIDLRAAPETLDFAGPTGAFARRQPLLRFSKLFDHKFRLDIAAETPENVIYIDATRRTRLPDFVVAGSYDFGGRYVDHLRVGGLFKDLNADSAAGKRDSAFGWVIGGSGKLKLPFLHEKDSFKFGVHYGEGYGGQLKSGPADALFNPATSSLEAIPVFSTFGGLQHWWTSSLRSNLVYGYVDADNPAFVPASSLDNTTYFAADLIWDPFKNVTVGFEYLYGELENFDGSDGSTHRFLWSSKVEF